MKKFTPLFILFFSLFSTCAFAGGLFSVGAVQSIFTSTAGSNSWKPVYRTLPIRDKICSSDNQCLAAGDSGTLFYNEIKDSDSLVPIKALGLGDTSQLMFRSIAFAKTDATPNGEFVIGGSKISASGTTPFIAYSTDRKNWQFANLTGIQAASGSAINSVTWDDTLKLFVAIGQKGLLLISADGHTWAKQYSATTNNLLSTFTDASGIYCVVAVADGSAQYLLRSTNGRVWNQMNIAGDTHPTVGFIHDAHNHYYVLANSTQQFFMTTTLTAPAWSPLSLPSLPSSNPLTAFGTYLDEDSSQDSVGYVVGQAEGKMYRTVNNRSAWKFTQAQDTSSAIVMFKNSQFFTEDGVYGDAVVGDIEMNVLTDMTYANGLYVAVGTGDGIVKSTDGIHWQSELASSIDNDLGGIELFGVTFANGKFYAVGGVYSQSADENTGVLLSSYDGATWTLVKQWPKTQIVGIKFHNNNFYLLASDQKLITSSDAINWHIQVLGIAKFGDPLNTLAFGPNNTAVIASTNGVIFTSTDGGKSWQHNTKMFDAYNSVVWDAYLGQYVASGSAGGIATSSGADIANNWQRMNTSIPANLQLASISLLENSLYVTGFDEGTFQFASYKSQDASHWDNTIISNDFIQSNQFDFS